MASDKPRKSRPAAVKRKKTDSATGRICILVLGMHRSGTSMLAGIFSHLGAGMAAKLMPANFANERGYYEAAAVSRLNDEILKSGGSSWSDWHPFNPGWLTSPVAEEFRQRAKEVIDEEFGSQRLILIKDPRICQLLPFWRSVLEGEGITPVVVHIHRNPLEVTASLTRRDGLQPGYSHLLWLRNVLAAECHSRDLKRHFTSYEEVLENWSAVAEETGAALGLSWPRMSAQVANEIETFIAPDLRHYSEDSRRVMRNTFLSEWLRDSYGILESWRETGESRSDRTRLDEIREQFDQSVPAFGGLVEFGARAVGDLAQTRTKLEKAAAEREQVERRLTEAEAAATAADQALSDLKAQAAETAAAHDTMQRSLNALETQLDSARGKTAEVMEERDEARKTAARLTAERNEARKTVADRTAERDEARKTMADLTAERDEARKTVAGLTAERDEARKTVAGLTAERDEAHARLETLIAENKALQQRAEALEAAQNQIRSELAQRQAETEDWATQVGVLEAQLAETAQEITHWKGRTGTLQEEVEQARLDQQGALVRQAQAAQQQQDRLQKELETAQRDLDTLASRQAVVEASLRENLRRETALVKTAHARDVAEMRKLNQALEEARRDIEGLLYDKEKLLGSTSWRLTAPLRGIMRRLRR